MQTDQNPITLYDLEYARAAWRPVTQKELDSAPKTTPNFDSVLSATTVTADEAFNLIWTYINE